jgi:hypothetical protein
MPPLNNNHTTTEERYVLCGPCQDVITRTVSEELGSQWSGLIWLVSVSIRELLKFSCCELQLWEASSWGTGTVRGTSALGSGYQKIGEDTAGWEELSVCSSELGTVRRPRVRGTSAFGSGYQKIGEDTAGWEELSVCSSELGTVRRPRVRGTSAFGSGYQKIGEDSRLRRIKCVL